MVDREDRRIKPAMVALGVSPWIDNVVTRFNPTVNGPLHVGHAYSALVNQQMAREAVAGTFLLRFDDNQRLWRSGHTRRECDELALEQLDDLAWLGVEPARIWYQSVMEREVWEILAASKWQPVIDWGPGDQGMETRARIIHEPAIWPHTLNAYVGAEKVVCDHLMGVTAMYRGYDQLIEHHYYQYLCALMGYPFPSCVYGPRLVAREGESLTGGVGVRDISKTHGNWRIRDLRAKGVRPETVLEVLADSCQKYPTSRPSGWTLKNLRPDPVLTLLDLK